MARTQEQNASKIHTDVLIIGGGMAGTTAAAMLGRAGIDAILVDPNPSFQHEFRCEKLSMQQLKLLEKTGFKEEVEQAAAQIKSVLISRYGHALNHMSQDNIGFTYDAMVNAVRRKIDGSARFITDKVVSISNTRDMQEVTLLGGDTITSRLIVLACGLNPQLQSMLNIERETLSKNHILCTAFDIVRKDGQAFEFDSLTYWTENIKSRMAYFTAFPTYGSATSMMRVNLFGYWGAKDELVAKLRNDTKDGLEGLMPNLTNTIGDFEVVKDRFRIRPVELYQSSYQNLEGVVMVGDAYSTSCPGAGTGVSKVLTDVVQLCNIHIPKWLESSGMSSTKLESFYRDEVKLEADKSSLDAAFSLRELSMNNNPKWMLKRWVRYVYHALKGARWRFMKLLKPARSPQQLPIQAGE